MHDIRMSQTANGPVNGIDLVLADTGAYHRRRLVLNVIAEETKPISLETLAKKIAMLERDNTDEDQYDLVALTLHHVHLPQLAEANIIEYDVVTHEISSRTSS